MVLALLLPGLLLGYLAGIACLVTGLGWLAAIAAVMGTGSATVLATALWVSARRDAPALHPAGP